MKKLLLALTAFGLNSAVSAQTVPAPTGVAAMVCANNTVTPSPIAGQFYYVQCDANGRLITSGAASVVNIVQQGASASAADNTTAIQAAINLAVANQQVLYIPSALTCYKYTAPLTIAGNLTIIGDESGGNWPGGAQINVPSGTPALQGSVLCPTSNGNNAIDITGTARTVNIRNLGILFQTLYTGTGNGISYIPTGTNQGLSGAFWENVTVFGHDGNHYGLVLTNPIYNTLIHIHGFGGGLLKLAGNSTTQHFGNSSWIEFYCNLFTIGTADCFNISASQIQALNLEAFIRPQANVNNTAIGGVTPPTSAQLIWNQDAFATNVNVFGADWESNVGSPIAFGNPTFGGIDWHSFFTSATTNFSYTEPSTGGFGILYNPKIGNGNFTNTTSSGTIAVEALYNIPGWHAIANSATTYTLGCTLCIAPPINGANVTITRKAAIAATGEIFTTGDVTAQGGLFVTGTTQVNTNAGTGTTEIGDGTTSGQVTIGGASNTTVLGSGANLKITSLAQTSAAQSGTMCYNVSGVVTYDATLGCLASSMQFKTDIHGISNSDALKTTLQLEPVSFRKKEDAGGDVDPDIQVGFLAEDVAKIDERLTARGKDGEVRGVRYQQMTAILAGAIKELKAENDNLRDCNNNWKCRIFGIR